MSKTIQVMFPLCSILSFLMHLCALLSGFVINLYWIKISQAVLSFFFFFLFLPCIWYLTWPFLQYKLSHFVSFFIKSFECIYLLVCFDLQIMATNFTSLHHIHVILGFIPIQLNTISGVHEATSVMAATAAHFHSPKLEITGHCSCSA